MKGRDAAGTHSYPGDGRDAAGVSTTAIHGEGRGARRSWRRSGTRRRTRAVGGGVPEGFAFSFPTPKFEESVEAAQLFTTLWGQFYSFTTI